MWMVALPAMPAFNKPVCNYIDGIIAVWLLVGIYRGKRRGMTQEILPTLQWIFIIVLGGLFYASLASLILKYCKGAFTTLWANITGYIIIAALIHLLFLWIKERIGHKLIGSDYFGAMEYRLGMLTGLLRFACIVIFVFALMHSRVYTDDELAAIEKFQQKSFEDIRFPTYATIQHSALKESFTGREVEANLDRLLITSSAGSGPSKPSQTPAAKSTEQLNAIIGPAKK